MNCFHSIGIPSEWGQQVPQYQPMELVQVSIQLGSPASGDALSRTQEEAIFEFPFNWDPQRVGT